MSLLLKAGITKLSELEIDADKDWQAKGISNIGTVVVTDGADHYVELPSLTTAQRDALAPSTGMTIWNSDNTRVEKYNGSDWGSMGIAGVSVRKNTRMPVVGSRPQLNIIEGASVGIQIADNPPDDEIDITISAKYPTRFMTLIPEAAAKAVPGGETLAALAQVVGTNFGYTTLDFDHTAEEVAYWEWYLTPDYLSENIVVDILWESAGAGDAKFGFSVLGREKGDTWDAALGAEQTVVTTNLGAGKLNKSRIATFSPNWSPGDAVLFKLARKAADGADTIDANDVRVLKVVVSYTGEFGQSFYPFAVPTDITSSVTQDGAYHTFDASAYIPAGATGVIVLTKKNALGTIYTSLRKYGSTDDHYLQGGRLSQWWQIVGVDEQRRFEYKLDADADFLVYLVGYTASGVVMFDNSYDKQLTLLSTWETIDLSVECPNAIGILVEIYNGTIANNREFAVRKFGSTDNRPTFLNSSYHVFTIIGCDGSQRIQGYADYDVANVHFYILGYITSGAVFRTNAANKSLTGTGWQDIDCSTEAPSGIMIFTEIYIPHEAYYDKHYGLQKKGDTANLFSEVQVCPKYAIVACDANQKIQGRIDDDNIDFFLVGYAQWAGA